MTNAGFADLRQYRDVESLNHFQILRDKGMSEESAYHILKVHSRDNARTPMQWSSERFAGFSDTQPWLGLNPSYLEINAQAQEKNPNSVLHYYRKLIQMRRHYPVFVHGDFVDCLPEDPQRYVYRRTLGQEKLLVLLNFSGEQTPFWQPADMDPARWEMLLCNYPAPQDACGPLRPYEARVFYQKEGEPCEKI